MDQQQPSTSGNGKERRKRSQATFQRVWFDDQVFKNWLTSHEDNTKAVCSVCNTVLSCGRTDLLRHSKTKKHIDNINISRNVNPSASLAVFNNNTYMDHVNEVKKAEIRFGAFYATHNIAFEIIGDMIPFIQVALHDSQIGKDLKMSRRKCTKIVTNILGKRETERVVNNLINNKFSILVDESTTITHDKVLCVLVQYFSNEKKNSYY